MEIKECNSSLKNSVAIRKISPGKVMKWLNCLSRNILSCERVKVIIAFLKVYLRERRER